MPRFRYNLLGIAPPDGYRWIKRGDIVSTSDFVYYEDSNKIYPLLSLGNLSFNFNYPVKYTSNFYCGYLENYNILKTFLYNLIEPNSPQGWRWLNLGEEIIYTDKLVIIKPDNTIEFTTVGDSVGQ